MKNLNWTKIIGIMTVIIALNLSAMAQNQVANDPEWKLIKTGKKGESWKLYKRKVPGTKLFEVKIVGEIKSSMQSAQINAMNLFIDSSVYTSKKGKSLGWFKIFKQTEDEIELYSFMKGSFPVKDRDVIVRYKTYEVPNGNALGVKWHQIDKPGYEATDTIIRMPVDEGDWRFDKIDENRCMATMKFHFQPGGSPPSWLINMVTKSYTPHEFEHLKKRCELQASSNQ